VPLGSAPQLDWAALFDATDASGNLLANSYGYSGSGNVGSIIGMSFSGSDLYLRAGGDAFQIHLGSASGRDYANVLRDGITQKVGLSDTNQTLVGVINVNTTQAGSNLAVETDLMTYALPANALSANNKGVRIQAWGTFAANANSKAVRLYFGATRVNNNFIGTFNSSGWYVEGVILRTGASAQVATGKTEIEATNEYRPATFTTPAENTANAITIRVTGQGVANNDIVARAMVIEIIN
jgi:hypothetical protein